MPRPAACPPAARRSLPVTNACHRRMQTVEVDFPGRPVEKRHHRKIVCHHAAELFGYCRKQLVHRELGNQRIRNFEQYPHPVALLHKRLPGEVSVHRNGELRSNPLQKCQSPLRQAETARESKPKNSRAGDRRLKGERGSRRECLGPALAELRRSHWVSFSSGDKISGFCSRQTIAPDMIAIGGKYDAGFSGYGLFVLRACKRS